MAETLSNLKGTRKVRSVFLNTRRPKCVDVFILFNIILKNGTTLD